MKNLLMFVLVILFAVSTNAQWVQEGFEDTANDTLWNIPPEEGLFTGEGSLVFTNVNTPEPVQGDAALKVEWVVHSTESYGGYTEMGYFVSLEDSTFIDFSTANALRLWFYNEVPSTNANLPVSFRLKLHDAGGSANYWESEADHEDWYFEKAGVYDIAPGWNYIDMPLEVTSIGGNPNDQGFSLPGWSGVANNQELDLDKIVGYSIDWVVGASAEQEKSNGTVVFDRFELVGNRYDPVYAFEDASYDEYFSVDLMEWIGDPAQQSEMTLTSVTTEPFEGNASMQIDYTVNMSQSWGGYANLTHMMPEGEFINLDSNTHLVLYLKVLEAATGTPNRVTMRFNLYDGAEEGGNEQWYHTANVDIYNTSDWQQVIIPLVSEQGEGDMNFLRNTGFIIPDWESGFKGNKILDLDKIAGWKIEFSGTGDFGDIGEKSTGSIMVDLLIPGGFRETDDVPPVPPAGLSAVAGTYTNIVTWTDVPEEDKETYTIYYSNDPITDLSAPYVEVVQANVPADVQLVEHVLRAPGKDQEVSYYYAITATDKAGNVSDLSPLSSAVTNTAKGVPTISLSTPVFAADGDLSEWSNITPISLSSENGTATIVNNTTVDGDADLSAKVYVAVDNEFLYVAFDVTDDAVVVRPELATYLNDAPDLFIGLYDWHGAPHAAYKRGATPDYHLRFSSHQVHAEGLNFAVLDTSSENYYWQEKFPSGYIVEAKISLATLAGEDDNVFEPKLGMRIPIDLSINDNDAVDGEREGIITYSPNNQDQSWSSPSRWTYTWIGEQWTVGVEDERELTPYQYELSQNYPNPFNPTTQIRYSIEKPGMVSIKVFDVLGRQVQELVNDFHAAGVYNVTFNAANLSSGVYLYQVKADGYQSTKKMLLVK